MMVDSNLSRLTLRRLGNRLENSQEKRESLSETDLHHLPPLSPSSPQSPSSLRRGFHKFHNPRPPTPTPNRMRGENLAVFGKPRLSPLSSSSSTPKLSLNLDLSPLKEASITFFGVRKDTDKVDIMDSPRCVRSLPTSPVLHTRQRRPMRRLYSDSKDDRIIQWIQDVQEKSEEERDSIHDDDLVECFSTASTSDSSELELGSSPSLPAIQEHPGYSSRTSSLS